MAKQEYYYKTIYRRSDTGEICTEEYYKKHPKTTEKERVKVPMPSKKK